MTMIKMELTPEADCRTVLLLWSLKRCSIVSTRIFSEKLVLENDKLMFIISYSDTNYRLERKTFRFKVLERSHYSLYL